MKKFIIITSIFTPTFAIEKFSKISNVEVIVIGDKKTPTNWAYPKVTFVSIEGQEKLNFKLLKHIPYNHYSRKMVGYLLAIQGGAEILIDTDDDNIPFDDWQFPNLEGQFNFLDKDLGFVNIYQLFTKEKIWPRGLPLRLINADFDLENHLSRRNGNVGIWQGLADEDPDVDAIYRLTSDSPCYFEKRSEPVVLAKGTIAPFNTQNTLIQRELFSLLYLPLSVTFRFTDILRGLIAQPIMWLYDYHLGFTNATVVQKRNPHDYFKDFISEIPMYENIDKVFETVEGSISKSNTIEENLYEAYVALNKKGIVSHEEIKAVEAWLDDIKSLQKRDFN